MDLAYVLEAADAAHNDNHQDLRDANDIPDMFFGGFNINKILGEVVRFSFHPSILSGFQLKVGCYLLEIPASRKGFLES